MFKSRLLLSASLVLWWVATNAMLQAADPNPDDARLETYDKYFALSLKPTIKVPRAAANDVVVLFDTSASQSGAFREKGLATLRSMLSALAPEDRVRLFAVDVNAVSLTDTFVSPQSGQMKAALNKLEKRVPLGSTDMEVALDAVLASLPAKDAKPHSAVYIGDGVNMAGGFDPAKYQQLMGELVDRQTSVTSFAIGPRYDGFLLSTLANQTGGDVIIDGSALSAEQAGHTLANAATEVVVWPTSLQLPASFKEVYPQRMPPLRGDRDTVVVGVGASLKPFEVKVDALVDGEKTQLNWTVRPGLANDDNAYLAKLVESAQPTKGAFLPTVGTAGLNSVRQMANATAEGLAKQARMALAMNKPEQAKRLAQGARAFDNNLPQAQAIERLAQAPGAKNGLNSPLILVQNPANPHPQPATQELNLEPRRVVPFDAPGEGGVMLEDFDRERRVLAGASKPK